MAFFGTRMAKLKFENQTLKNLLEDKQDQIVELTTSRNEWRKKFELSLHTPEYKLDAEAAFKRGQQYTMTQVKNNLMLFLDTLPKDEPADAQV